ncbi:hypothetical protein COOONC_23203 [Cooperia oncophora]
MNNFVYRYIQLCRARLLYIYHSLKWAVVTYSVSVAMICNWVIMLYVNCPPNPSGTEFAKKVFTIPQYILCIECFSLVTILCTVGTLCAWRIDSCIRENAMSTQTKKMHRHMLIMLIVQAVCPGMFLNAPLLSIYLLFFAGIDSPKAMSYAISFLMASYSIFSPVIVLVFMRDYRNYILVTLRFRKPSEITKVTASDGKSVFTR